MRRFFNATSGFSMQPLVFNATGTQLSVMTQLPALPANESDCVISQMELPQTNTLFLRDLGLS
jgi:hypothetical protein